MASTHSAKIALPVRYLDANGKARDIPMEPCLVEQTGSDQVEIIWGSKGRHSAVLKSSAIVNATQHGHLILLDWDSSSQFLSRN